jgi:hypothetical protein
MTYNRIRLVAEAMGFPAPPARLAPVVIHTNDPRPAPSPASGQDAGETDQLA